MTLRDVGNSISFSPGVHAGKTAAIAAAAIEYQVKNAVNFLL
jgi:hypothetical protein